MITTFFRSKNLENSILIVFFTLVCVALISFSESYFYVVPILFTVGLLAYFFGTVVDGFLPLLFILISVTILENSPGIQPIEIPFYLISGIVILYVFIELVTGRFVIETNLDRLFLCLLLLLPIGVAIGIINGAAPYLAVGETTYFFGVLVYFPLRKHLNKKQFELILTSIIGLIIAYVLIRNILNYRQLIVQAILSWQAEKARVAANEVILMIGALFCLSSAALTKVRVKQLFFTASFVLFLGGLILTQSRGYWLAFAFGAFLIFYSINRSGKLRILLTFLLLSSSSIIVANIFFSDFLNVILNGLLERFSTIGSTKLDISLQERVLESETVFKMMLNNPIAGYGFGYTYTKKILFYSFFEETSYVHNGYLAIWLKLGLLGLITNLSIWILSIRNSIKLYRTSTVEKTQIISLTILGSVFGIMVVNMTSPQVLTFESTLFVTIFCAYVSSRMEKKTKIEA